MFPSRSLPALGSQLLNVLGEVRPEEKKLVEGNLDDFVALPALGAEVLDAL